MATLIHLNKTGLATAVPNGEATNPVWTVDNPAIATVTPRASNPFVADIQPLALGPTTVRCQADGLGVINGASVIEIVPPLATSLTVTTVEN